MATILQKGHQIKEWILKEDARLLSAASDSLLTAKQKVTALVAEKANQAKTQLKDHFPTALQKISQGISFISVQDRRVIDWVAPKIGWLQEADRAALTAAPPLGKEIVVGVIETFPAVASAHFVEKLTQVKGAESWIKPDSLNVVPAIATAVSAVQGARQVSQSAQSIYRDPSGANYGRETVRMAGGVLAMAGGITALHGLKPGGLRPAGAPKGKSPLLVSESGPPQEIVPLEELPGGRDPFGKSTTKATVTSRLPGGIVEAPPTYRTTGTEAVPSPLPPFPGRVTKTPWYMKLWPWETSTHQIQMGQETYGIKIGAGERFPLGERHYLFNGQEMVPYHGIVGELILSSDGRSAYYYDGKNFRPMRAELGVQIKLGNQNYIFNGERLTPLKEGGVDTFRGADGNLYVYYNDQSHPVSPDGIVKINSDFFYFDGKEWRAIYHFNVVTMPDGTIKFFNAHDGQFHPLPPDGIILHPNGELFTQLELARHREILVSEGTVIVTHRSLSLLPVRYGDSVVLSNGTVYTLASSRKIINSNQTYHRVTYYIPEDGMFLDPQGITPRRFGYSEGGKFKPLTRQDVGKRLIDFTGESIEIVIRGGKMGIIFPDSVKPEGGFCLLDSLRW